jgi:ABC-type branched-subunit amino acid transport system substrate-binding protein
LWQESGKPEDAKRCLEHLGSNFRNDPDFINRVRQLGFSSVKEYLAFIGYDETKAMKQAEDNLVRVKSHEVLKRAKAVETEGGGVEFGTGEVLAKGAIGDVAMPV